jgi:hypothetical protein
VRALVYAKRAVLPFCRASTGAANARANPARKDSAVPDTVVSFIADDEEQAAIDSGSKTLVSSKPFTTQCDLSTL